MPEVFLRELAKASLSRSQIFSVAGSADCNLQKKITCKSIAMAPHGSCSCRGPLAFLLLLAYLLCGSAVAFSPDDLPLRSDEGYDVEGRIKVEGMGGTGPSKTANIKVILNGGQQVAFIRPEGSFTFKGVPAGTHLLEVVALNYFFPPVRVDVSSRLQGQVRASYVEGTRRIPDSLVLEPLREENYFEMREPFSLFGLLKSPMGLMIGFMVVCVVLLPKMVDSIDPEEMKKLQEAQRNQPSPLANLLQGRN